MQIEKVGCDPDANVVKDNDDFRDNDENTRKSDFTVIKTEPIVETLYVQSCLHCGNDTTLSTDDDDEVYPNDTFYTNKGQTQRFFPNQKAHNSKQNQFNNTRNRPTPNPLNRFGHYTACDFCKCIYHYLPDCPHCPHDIKLQYSSKKQQFRYGSRRNNNNYSNPTF